MGGYGYPTKKVGLIHSMFRPSDDATVYPFLIPSNLFAFYSLLQLNTIVGELFKDSSLIEDSTKLMEDITNGIINYGVINHEEFGKIYAYEVNGFGSFNLMDDANVPSLLAIPYLLNVQENEPIHINTRKFVLSQSNPFFFKGKVAEGIGGPHVGMDYIWPMSIIMRAITSTNDAEIKQCVQWLKTTHAGTGFMHESFHKDDPKKFTRKWFAWANTLFGELLLKVVKERPHLV